ncbi:MAG TPA: pitrilysin family protein [Holophaga sp.]|nr:pitrilysin family protein [Holophaga sp.]
MRRSLRYGWGLAAILAAGPLAAQTPPVLERTLSNGMKLVMVERHDQPTIALGWMARVGSANERPGITGLAHLFEHMMFKGTRTLGTRDAKRDAELNRLQDGVQAKIREEMAVLRERQRRGEIPDMMDPRARTPRLEALLKEFDALVKEQRALVVKDEMDQIYTQAGATGINASTSEDRTFYICSLPSNKLELWMWIESDRLANPVFREFYSERDVILEERRQTLESRPTGLVDEAFNALTWKAVPYTWEVIGWPSDIAQVTREQADEFFATYYAPNNLTAVLVGDFDPDRAAAMAERYLGRVPANPRGVPPIVTLEPPQVAEQRMNADAETTPTVTLDFKTVSSVHKDAPALMALAGILGGAQAFPGRFGQGGAPRGRLHKALVLEAKAATSATAHFSGMRYGGTFGLRAVPGPGRTPEELEPMVLAELEKIARDGVTDDELQRYKNAAEVGFHTRMESNTGIRETLSQYLSAGDVADFRAALDRIRAVTKEDVKAAASKYFPKASRNVLVVHRKGAPAMPRPGSMPPSMPKGEVK